MGYLLLKKKEEVQFTRKDIKEVLRKLAFSYLEKQGNLKTCGWELCEGIQFFPFSIKIWKNVNAMWYEFGRNQCENKGISCWNIYEM